MTPTAEKLQEFESKILHTLSHKKFMGLTEFIKMFLLHFGEFPKESPTDYVDRMVLEGKMQKMRFVHKNEGGHYSLLIDRNTAIVDHQIKSITKILR